MDDARSSSHSFTGPGFPGRERRRGAAGFFLDFVARFLFVDFFAGMPRKLGQAGEELQWGRSPRGTSPVPDRDHNSLTAEGAEVRRGNPLRTSASSAVKVFSALKIELHSRGKRPVVRRRAVDVETDCVLEVELADVVFRHDTKREPAAHRDVGTDADVAGEIRRARLDDRLGDVVPNAAGARLEEGRQAERARGRVREIELEVRVVHEHRALADGYSTQVR